MKKRFLCMILSIVMALGSLQGFSLTANAASNAPKTAKEAVADMTWGVNLVDLYIAEPEVDLRRQESTVGYVNYTPKEIYDLCVAIWFWDNSFEWIQYYPMEKQDSYQISVPIPDYDAAIAAEREDWAFFTVRCGDTTGGQNYKLTLSDCKITAANGTVLISADQLGTHGDGVFSCEGTTSLDGDINGWHWGYSTQENNWQGDINWFAEWDEDTQQNKTGADPMYNGATFTATLTIDTASLQPVKTKAQYYYCLNRTQSDYKALVDAYIAQGVNVFRLPVTWTWFTQNDDDFAIDAQWLEAVRGTVDYILSKGAYCILNTHDDYLQYSYVAQSDGNGGYTNFHWEDQWMEAQYKDYVDARFTAIWTQIADYFKGYPDHLIFESMNEPSMNWYYGVDFENWRIRQSNRINEMNRLFVNTVRASGGNNATRILCLPTNDYCSHDWLDELTIPEESDYIMVQIHSYADNEGFEWSNERAMDTLFSNVAAFKNTHPKVGLILGEVGISHSLANRADPEGTVNTASAFVGRAVDNDVPFLWWEDFFAVYDGYEADKVYWLYDKKNFVWREDILQVIQQALGIEKAALTAVTVTSQPDKTEYTAGEAFDPTGMVVCAVYSDGSTQEITGYTCTPTGALTERDTAITISYTEGGVTQTATVSIRVQAQEVPCDHTDENKDHICDRSCGEINLGTHADADKDHNCDYGCGQPIGEHADASTDADHLCDYGCGAVLEACADTAGDHDHDCDVCGKQDITGHDYGNADCETPAACLECGETAGSALGHADENKDHICDRDCGETNLGTHADANKDHSCDYGCARPIGEHTDASSDADHVCDYGCGAVLEACTDAAGDNNHDCDVCGREAVSDHFYGSDSVCDECGSRSSWVEMPVFTPKGGTFADTQSVTITTITDGAEIYYTTDGTVPSAANGLVYTGAITIRETTTVKAIAVLDGNVSGVVEATFTRQTEDPDTPDVPSDECDGGIDCPMYVYKDLDTTQWYHDGVHFCLENNLMNGISGDRFAPDVTTSRAMIVTILWRLEGEPLPQNSVDFTDVTAGQWYTAAVQWAASNGVVLGYGNGTFGPNDEITREQMVTIMYRYAGYKGYDLSVGGNIDIFSYSDASDVAGWAVSAMQWACGEGLIQGFAAGNRMNLKPQGSATRAQSAAILQRYCENVANDK